MERSAARRSKVVRFGLNRRKVGGCGLTSGDIFAEDEGVAIGIADDELVHAPFSWLQRFGGFDSGGFELRLEGGGGAFGQEEVGTGRVAGWIKGGGGAEVEFVAVAVEEGVGGAV